LLHFFVQEDAGSEGGSQGKDGDDDDGSLDTVGRFDEHNKNSTALKGTAREAFFKNSNHYRWTNPAGRAYIIWAYKKAGEMSSAGHKWPHAFVDEESQTINAAAWAVDSTSKAVTLACLWTFSPGGDETNEYYVEAYKKDMWEFSGLCNGFSSDSPITDEASREHFSVSSGDYLVPEFHCPALETVTAAEMQAFEKKYARK